MKKTYIFFGTILLTVLIIYIFFPNFYWFGGRDHGLYIINGVHLSKTGGILYESDHLLAQVYTELGEIAKPYPGLFSAVAEGLSEDAGIVIPQFMPLYFIVTAISYSLAGLTAAFRINGLITLFSMGVIYFFCKDVFSKKVSLLATLFIAFNPAQIWNGKVPGSEMLSQLLLFFALYCCKKALRNNSSILSIFTGCILGLNLLCRMDALIYGLSIYAFWIYAILLEHKHEKLVRTMSLTYSIFFILQLAYFYIYSRPYAIDHWKKKVLSGILLLNVVFFAIALLCFFFKQIFKRKKSINKNSSLFFSFLDKKYILPSFLVLGTLAFIYTYFFRPYPSVEQAPNVTAYFTSDAMRQFCWYSSFIAVPLAIYGLYVTFQKSNLKRNQTIFFILIGMPSFIGYIYKPSITPDHFWASRRWIPTSIPFVLILCAVACIHIWESHVKSSSKIAQFQVFTKRFFAFLCVAFIFVSSYNQSSLYIFKPMLGGTLGQLEQLANNLDTDAVYLTTNELIAGPLKYVYDKPVFIVNASSDYPDKIDGREVYFMARESEKTQFEKKHEFISTYTITGLYPEKTINSYPQNLYVETITVYIYKINSIYKIPT